MIAPIKVRASASGCCITIDLTALADLLHLFGIGKSSNGKLSVSAGDAIFYPAALIIWAAIYTKTGQSISDVTELKGSSTQLSGEPALTGSTGFELFKIGQLAVDFVVAAQAAGAWAITAETPEDEIIEDSALEVFVGVKAWFNLLRRTVDFTEFASEVAAGQKQLTLNTAPDLANALLRLETAVLEVVFTKYDKVNTTFPTPKDVLAGVNALLALGIMGWDTYQVIESQPDANDIIKIVGQDIGRTQSISISTWRLTMGGATELLEIFAACIAFAPYGCVMQAGAVADELGGTGGGFGRCPRDNGKGKGKGKGRR